MKNNLKEACARYKQQGLSAAKTADKLNSLGYKSAFGNKINKQTVYAQWASKKNKPVVFTQKDPIDILKTNEIVKKILRNKKIDATSKMSIALTLLS